MTNATSITVRVPLAIRHRPGRKTVVTPLSPGPAAVTTRADPALVKALARAFRYQRLLDEAQYTSISEMAAAERPRYHRSKRWTGHLQPPTASTVRPCAAVEARPTTPCRNGVARRRRTPISFWPHRRGSA